MQRSQILIIENADIIAAGLSFFLAKIPSIETITVEQNFKTALKLIDKNHYNVILLDLCIHDYAGFDFLERLLAHKPKSNVLTFSDYCTFVYALKALKIGAKGYFSIDISSEDFLKAVELVAKGHNYMDAVVAQEIALQMINGEDNLCSRLSTREFEVFRLLTKGLDSHKIAERLCIGYKTTCNYVSKIRIKLNVQNNLQLINLANEYGLTSQALRKEAEAQFALPTKVLELYSNDELLHELHLHELELKMQNEELRSAQQHLEESLACYRELYDFAPVAYLTLTEQGLIKAINLTGATLLGVEKQSLLQRRFAGFVADEYTDHWHLFFAQILKQTHRKTIELALKLTQNFCFYVRLDCLPVSEDRCLTLRIIMTDLTDKSNGNCSDQMD
jgi:PAS domain S-box-containing protein